MSTDSKSLVALAQEYNALVSLLMETGGELTPELEAMLSVNQELLAKKADAYDFLISKLETEESYWKLQADRYAKVARACANARERLRGAIKVAMQGMGTTEITGENVAFKLSNSAPKLVLDQTKLPSTYIIETIVREPNKDKIRADLKAGLHVDGASLEPVVALRVTVARKVK